MNISELLLKEFETEMETTRKMLTIVPDGKFDYKPHKKSMHIKELTTHIADLPTWFELAVHTDELDFENNPYNPGDFNDTKSILEYFEKAVVRGRKALQNFTEEIMDKTWILRSGETIYVQQSKYEFIRVTFAQIIHHRAQLGVYLRLLNIPIPGSYGPSADELEMFAAAEAAAAN